MMCCKTFPYFTNEKYQIILLFKVGIFEKIQSRAIYLRAMQHPFTSLDTQYTTVFQI